MSQVSGTPATAYGRSTWRVLRPVLMLGGFVAVWWALSTGVAHADGPQGLGDTVRAATKAQHSSPVRDVVRGAHHEAKPTTTKVRHQAEPVSRAVSSVVDSTPIAPVTSEVRETVRSTVSETVEKTRSVLTKTTSKPAGDKVRAAVKKSAPKPQSSTQQGNSRSERASKKPSTAASPTLTFATPGQQATSSALTSSAAADSQASIEAEPPLESPGGTLPVHDPCASPSGSGSTSTTPVGITESPTFVMPAVLRDLPTWRLARLPGDPAYQPGSSPD